MFGYNKKIEELESRIKYIEILKDSLEERIKKLECDKALVVTGKIMGMLGSYDEYEYVSNSEIFNIILEKLNIHLEVQKATDSKIIAVENKPIVVVRDFQVKKKVKKKK